MPTLYQTYRPQNFSDLVGQEHIIQTITNEIKNNRNTHAYLFYGPRGIGKTTLARLLAKSLNCTNRKDGESEPCGQCDSCQTITNSGHIDVIEIDAASHTGVDNVRDNIIDSAQFKPTNAKYKVFIIDEVHMLSNSAFNALLKTLEEPPQHVIFILATTELHKIPATIISRCERFGFKKIAYKEMLIRLEKICESEKVSVDKIVLERIINKSDGCLRDAESLLGQILSLNLEKVTASDCEIILPSTNVQTILNWLAHIIGKETKLATDLLQTMVDEGVNLEQFAFDVLEVLRLAMILKTDTTKDIGVDYSENDAESIKKIADKLEYGQLITMIEALIIRRFETKTTPIPQLPLELFVVEFTTNSLTINTPQPNNNDGDDDSGENNTVVTQENTTTSEPNNPPPIEPKKTETKISKIKEKITTKIKNRKNITTTLDHFKTKWGDVVKALTAENHSLGFIFKMSEIKELTKTGELVLTVPFSIHKDRLEAHATRSLIETCLEDFFKEKISLNCQVDPDAGYQPTKQVDNEISDLAADFGGKVVG